MLDQHRKMEIIKRLQLAQEAELSRDEMEQMLSEELEKPEAEMDAALVTDLLELMEEDVPGAALSREQQQCSWRRIQKRLTGRQWPRVLCWAARIAAVVALFIGVFFATYQTAEAFEWRSLLRFMQPLAEVFTLYTEEIPEESVVQTQPGEDGPSEVRGEGMFLDSRNKSAVQKIADYASAPERLHGYLAKPKGIPERFVYAQGSVTKAKLMTAATYVFLHDGDACIFSVRIPIGADEEPSIYQYEKTIAEPEEMQIGLTRVSYYLNSRDKTLSASWTDERVQYTLFGILTQEEMATIIKRTMERQDSE